MMSKKGVSAVSGNISPAVGEKQIYHIADWYPDTPKSERKPEKVTWELFRKRKNGKFTTTNIRKKGNSSFTFGESSLGKTYRLEGYLHEPEGGGLIITPKQNKIPQISKIELLYVDNTKGSTFSFMEKLRAKAYCVNMFNKEVVFILWEDDAKGAGHSKNNMLVETQKARVNEKGVAVAEFSLMKGLMTKAMRGEHDGELDFYVTVEYFKTKKHATENVEIIYDPFPRKKIPPLPSPPAKEKGKSKKEEKGIGDKIVEAGKELWDWWESKGTATKEKQTTVQKPEGKSPAIVKEMKLENKKDDKKVCECEARVRAFMRMLRYKEGTEGEDGYKTQYSNKKFSDFSTHPQKVITDSKGKHNSSAAGAYQIMTDTWKNLTGHYQGEDKKWYYSEKIDYAKKYNISSFDQESQDKFCLVIMKHNYLKDRADSFYNPTIWKNKEKKIHDTVQEEKQREWRKRFKGQQGDIIQMIIDGDIKRATLISSLCWASLPDSPYGQQSSAYTFAVVKAIYEKNLREELIEPSKELHLKKGFLKEFGYGCCGEGKKEELVNRENKCPEDCSQCYDYADIWENPEISNDNHGKNNNRFGYNSARGHKGIDILSGPKYKDIHSLMCGEVVAVVNSFKTNEYKQHSLGNTLMIKSKDKDRKEVFILYCHLDKIYVKKGEKVKHAQKIALSGSTGNASYSGLPNGLKGHGIDKNNWHCHIEAATKGEGYNNFLYLGKYRIKAEDYMKTKFDKDGNAIK